MNRHRQRVIGLIMIGILTAGALVGGGWWLGQRSQTQSAASGGTTAPSASPPAADTTTPATPTSPANAGTWQRLPAAPIPGGSYAGVWTGTELLLHAPYFDHQNGSYIGRSVGAAYNPATHSWRNLPPAPGPVESIEGGYQTVWTGRELLGWGMGLDAAYNPATNHWRKIATGGSAWAVMAWTGRQVLTCGGGCCGDDMAGGAAYTPSTDRWSRLPAGPLAGRQQTTGTWTGTELVVVGGNNVDAKVFDDAAAYNPATRSWRRLPALPEPRTGATVTWNGREVLVVGGQGRFSDQARPYAHGVAYSPASNRWRRLPAMDTGRIGHTAVCTGRQLLVWGGRTRDAGSWTAPAHGLAYDRAGDRWSPLPRSPLRGRAGHVAGWTGSQMLIWGGTPAGASDPRKPFADGAAYTPTRCSRSSRKRVGPMMAIPWWLSSQTRLLGATAPAERDQRAAAGAAVGVLYGSAGGLTATGSQGFWQGTGGAAGTAEAGDLLGSGFVGGDPSAGSSTAGIVHGRRRANASGLTGDRSSRS